MPLATSTGSARRLVRTLILTGLACVLAACQDPLRPQMSGRDRAIPGALRRSAQFTPSCASQLPPKPDASPYGVVVHLLAARANPVPPDPISDTTYGTISRLFGEANVGWVRVDFDWGRVIGTSLDVNQLNWTPIDATVNRALCSGMHVLGGLAYTPAVASTRTVPVDSMRFTYMPDNVGSWAAFVQAAVTRYPQIRYWSVWNEPNSPGFFRGYAGEADVVPAYEALLDAAAPYIRQPADGQGPRNLVAPELAGGRNDGSDPWLRRVLVDRGSIIDVVAVHTYGDTSGAGVRDYVAGLPGRLALPSWPWPIWLTEVGVTGCNATPEGLRYTLGYCTGPNQSYIADGFQSGFVSSVVNAMRAGGGAPWAKTFFYDAVSEVLRDSVGEAYGLLGGARANNLFARPAFTVYASLAGPLGVSGAGYGYDENVTVTATPAVPTSYYYVWEYQWCYNGRAPGDCDHQWHSYNEGQDLTSIAPYVYRQDYYVYTRVRQYAWKNGTQLGPQIGGGRWDITGAGECTSSCGGGGGMLSSPSAITVERLKGRKGGKNK